MIRASGTLLVLGEGHKKGFIESWSDQEGKVNVGLLIASAYTTLGVIFQVFSLMSLPMKPNSAKPTMYQWIERDVVPVKARAIYRRIFYCQI